MSNDFDIASQLYDVNFTNSKIGMAQRNRVYKYLKAILPQDKKLSILELNCGTGEDAIHFASLGHHVIATDSSKGMISVAKSKTYFSNLNFKILDINTIDKNTFSTKFDLIFSNFGGFNCLSETQLTSFFKKSIDLLNPKGKLIVVFMPKQCLWEQFYFTLKGNFKKARRRKTNIYCIANVDGVSVKTWYYNPKDILKLSKLNYLKQNIKPVGLAIPPSYLESSFLTKAPFLSIFKRIDSIFTNAFWAKYADHFYIELKKR